MEKEVDSDQRWKEIALKYKEQGITEELFKKWWDKKYPLMEKELTEKLLKRLFHTFMN